MKNHWLKNYCILIIALLTLSVFTNGQTKQKQKTSHPPKNTIIYEVLKKLAEPNACGEKADSSEVYTGTVMKRDFAEDEIRLSGFVLRTSGDNREYINLDFDYISELAAIASGDLRN